MYRRAHLKKTYVRISSLFDDRQYMVNRIRTSARCDYKCMSLCRYNHRMIIVTKWDCARYHIHECLADCVWASVKLKPKLSHQCGSLRSAPQVNTTHARAAVDDWNKKAPIIQVYICGIANGERTQPDSIGPPNKWALFIRSFLSSSKILRCI